MKRTTARLYHVAGIVCLLFIFSGLSGMTVAKAGEWTWQNPIAQGNDLVSVWGTSGSDVFAVGYGGTILRYDGSAWSPMTSGTTQTLWGVWGTTG
ncbi:MAG: WD40 repeat domain-containing protein, partial [Deltaproteobacteria bacterium]|nr:WD40 repeat domain-containing protein [Deltaproteobacteria bacterium]